MTNIIESELGFTSENELVIPRGMKGLPPLKIDISSVREVEKTMPQLVGCSIYTFPSIVMIINLGLRQLTNVIATVDLELKEAKRLLEESKAIALLDKTEDILKSKGQKSTADTREAVVLLDMDVREYRRKFDILTATMSMVINMKEDFSKTYFSAKMILDANSSIPDQVHCGGNL